MTQKLSKKSASSPLNNRDRAISIAPLRGQHFSSKQSAVRGMMSFWQTPDFIADTAKTIEMKPIAHVEHSDIYAPSFACQLDHADTMVMPPLNLSCDADYDDFEELSMDDVFEIEIILPPTAELFPISEPSIELPSFTPEDVAALLDQVISAL